MRVRGTLQVSANLAELMSNMLQRIVIIFILVINTLYVKSTPVKFATQSPFEETGSTMQEEDLDMSLSSAKISAFSSTNDADDEVCCKNGCLIWLKSSYTICNPIDGPCKMCGGGGWVPKTCTTYPNCQ